MFAQYIHIAYTHENERWEAISIVDGSLYKIHGRSPSALFEEMCNLLGISVDRWRVTELAPGEFECEHWPDDAAVLNETRSADENANVV